GPKDDAVAEKAVADLTRMASAITALFSSPAFDISSGDFAQLVTLNRWISAMFHTTPFRNTDHILKAVAGNGLSFRDQEIVKLAIFFSRESLLTLPIDDMFAQAPKLATCTALAIISSRQLISRTAHQKREALLKWLPQKIAGLGSLDEIPVDLLHNAIMH